MTRIVAVTSGKDGVGKTHLSINLALQCARRGLRTCLFDTDPSPVNASRQLGLVPMRTLSDVLTGGCHLSDILLSSHGVDIIPGGEGNAAMRELTSEAMHRLGSDLSILDRYDLIIFDTSSVATGNVLAFTAATPEVFLVITPEPNALTDAYALVKVLRQRHYAGQIRVIVNQARSEHQARHTYEKFREVVRVYQGVDLSLLGTLPYATEVASAGVARTPVLLRTPESPAAYALEELAERIMRSMPETKESQALQTFWYQLTGTELPESPPVPAPITTAPVAESTSPEPALPNVLSERLTRLEVAMEALLQELSALRKDPAVHTARLDDVERRIETPVVPKFDRRNTDALAPARSVRSAQRATPIDALQLRRVVGRMLVKAMPLESLQDDEPVRIGVDQIQLDGGNDFSLRPGRYTRISLHCHHIHKPDNFIEEIFSNCAITGCKVRHLGSQVRYWVTSGRDGCILLDGDDNDRNCVQVYMAAGGNSLLDTDSTEPEAVPKLRRITEKVSAAMDAMPAQLLGKFPHQRLLVEGAEGDTQEIFRLLRRDRSPLLCAFHQADGDSAAGHLRERSP